uniref:hypothetical protein n=1 Tax=Microbispora cellulosiformans TaxID=2614688 RepID=UPI00178429E3|nr:hypothetical protein [Microbispora cellulosiformans]
MAAIGVLYRILGKDAWHVWTDHVSAATRGKSASRQRVVTDMTQALRKAWHRNHGCGGSVGQAGDGPACPCRPVRRVQAAGECSLM